MLVSELIERSLRLINEPGRGMTLGSDDQAEGLTALQEILDSEAGTKLFVSGIARHFFTLTAGQAIYTYGADAGLDFRSDDFGDLTAGLGDPAPIDIEDAYIRAGAVITDNELIDEYRFEATGSWSLDADPDVDIVDNQYKVETPAAATSSTQALSGITAGEQYTLRVKADVIAGDLDIQLRDSAVAFQTFTIDGSGFYEFDFTWPTIVSPDINLVTDLTTDDIRLDSLSLMLTSKRQRLELGTGGSDYQVRIMDQKGYNREFSKGTSGRPYRMLYTRDASEIGDLRFDHAALGGDTLVMDVRVNRTRCESLDDTLRVNPQGIKWLRYALADHLAPEYGKALSARQVRIMEDAWNLLARSNRRINMLSVDRGLRQRRHFDINRGDP